MDANIQTMAKLNKTQIIFLGLMCVALIYGAYEIFFNPSSAKKVKVAQFENKAVNESVLAVLKDSPSERMDAYIIARAENEWPKDPFWERNQYKQWLAKDEVPVTGKTPSAKFVYSGYVDAGKKKMAIINGIEYGEGDYLEIEGYELKSITSTKVKIKNKNTGNMLEILLQD